jgi:hypothetical protein
MRYLLVSIIAAITVTAGSRILTAEVRSGEVSIEIVSEKGVTS